MAFANGFTPNFTLHLAGGSLTGFLALYAFAVNISIAAILTPLFHRLGMHAGSDLTTAADYA
jgi:hypothetical protein